MTGAGTKRVLLVAFHYPPDLSSSGVLRTLKFSRYLREHGWEPVVLTARENCYESTDPALLEQIPAGVEVRRTRAVTQGRRSHSAAVTCGSTRFPTPTSGGCPLLCVQACRSAVAAVL